MERFFRYFPTKAERPKKGCWVWKGHKVEGYGRLALDRSHGEFAHRLAYEHFVGPIPEGLWVLHRCDNRPCVRPDHLFLGTPKDNTQDMIQKGRGNNWSVLTTMEVKAIRAAYIYRSPTNGLIPLGRRFGVAHTTIHAIVRGKNWKRLREH